jgi:L-fucose isomerase-like protein
MMAARGEIVECRDTICDRTTLTLRVQDARDFVHKAAGNHQVVVYGDYLGELRELCGLLGMGLREA